MSTVAALGDSVTVGVGDVGAPSGWAAHLAWSLGADRFVNAAKLGARARDVATEQTPVALRLRPQLATVLVGGNDVLRGDFQATAVADDVERTVAGLVATGSDVVVVLLHDPREVLPAPRLIRDVLSERASWVNHEVTARLAGAERVALVDPMRSPVTVTREAWSVDRLHPSAVGHRALAQMAMEALAPMGWLPYRPVLPPTADVPSRATRAWWLLRHGTPWCAKRSRDLLPELALACWRHHRTHRERRNLVECA